MSIEKADFDAIAEQDLQELVDAQVPEGLRLEFKSEIYGSSDKDKRELLKDISALANSHGGHLVIGVKENEGVAADIPGVDVNSDDEILRMERMVRDATEPPISGIRMRSISLKNNRKVILLRIPRSWNPPHRVTFKGINRFYIRHSAGVHEPSVEELRALFDQSSTALEKARQFRNRRINEVCSGEDGSPLADEGRLFMHIVPTAAFSGRVNLDVEIIHKSMKSFKPIGALNFSPQFNFHGYINKQEGSENLGYTQIFRNGILEATKAYIVRSQVGHSFILGLDLEKEIFHHMPMYLNRLRDIGVPPPLIIMFTFEGIKGKNYVVGENTRGGHPLPYSPLFLPECFLEDYGEDLDYHRAVRPAFDALWNAIGFSKSQFFNDEGRWVG